MKTPRFSLRFIVVALVGLGGMLPASAANGPDPLAASPVPQLLVPDDQGEKKRPLRMSELEIDVEVIDERATTTLTMTFRNELDRVLEGELVFPLGDGESVSRFAMSLATVDQMREGVVVEKDRGRQIFESTVRQQVDPGLLEMTKGNHFRSRVYPIPAQGEKRIIVGFEGELAQVEGVLVYELPFAFEQPIDRVKVAARVLALGGEQPSFAGLLEGADGAIAGTLHHASVERKDFRPSKPLRITLPQADARAARVVTFTEPAKPARAGEPAPTYFHATVPVDVPATEAQTPGKICVLWDASGSAGAEDREVALAALGTYLAGLGKIEVTVVAFRERPGEPQAFQLAGGDPKALTDYLRAIRPDGGTRFGAIDLNKYDADLFVLVSDGVGTFGKGEVQLGEKPVIALNASKSADHGYLRSVARASGGQYINLLATTGKDAAAAMESERLAFLGVEGGGELLEETYPTKGAPVEGDRFRLAGVLNGPTTELTLNFGIGDRVLVQQKITVESGAEAQSPRARRLWAQAKIAELAMRFDANRDELVAVAMKHAIVTRATSLIVLDTLDDYVRHRVIPPTDMQDAYFEKIEAAKLEQEAPQREHLDQIAASFEQQRKWYETEFPGIEAAIVASAKFEVERARALIDDTGKLRLVKRKRLTEETLKPAEQLLVEAQALEAAEKDLPEQDAAARAEWQGEVTKLAAAIAAFSAERDKLYPDFTRASVGGDGAEAPFGGGGASFFSFGEPLADAAAPEEANEGRDSRASDPFSAGSAAPSVVARPAPPRRSGGFPVTPATPAADDAFAPAEIPQSVVDSPLTAGLRSGSNAITAEAIDNLLPQTTTGPATISLKEWDPDAPYLKALQAAGDDEIYPLYLQSRADNADSSAFFLDAADFFIEKQQPDLALRVLSNIAEMDLENAPLLRILGHRLLQLGEPELAADVFEEVLAIRPEEPQSYRDLALAKQAAGDNRRAAELLWEVVRRPWDGRFSDIGLIALGELNALIALGGEDLVPVGMDSRLRGPMPVDLRVVLTWDADNTDIDLWVIDPTGEVCKYDHNRTVTGGRMSEDFTGGYGPEEFLIKRALPGKYTIKAHFYGNHQQTLAGATTIQAKVTTGYGRADEKTEALTLRLKDENEVVEVGSVTP